MSIRKTTFRLPRQLALLAACALSILVFAADLRAAEIVIADGTKVEVNAGNKVRISKGRRLRILEGFG